jgi:hypothetical protein
LLKLEAMYLIQSLRVKDVSFSLCLKVGVVGLIYFLVLRVKRSELITSQIANFLMF